MQMNELLLQQAQHCRRAWQAGALADARLRLGQRTDREARIWERVLDRQHPLAAWLDGNGEEIPEVFPDGSSSRQLFSSHPFTGWHPWLNRLTFPESSSMPHDS